MKLLKLLDLLGFVPMPILVGLAVVIGLVSLGTFLYSVALFGARILAWIGHVIEVIKHRSTLKGRVVATGELQRSPFLGAECVMYETEILRLEGDPIYDRKGADLIIESDAGRVRVAASDVVLKKKFDLFLKDADPKYTSVIERYGHTYEDWRVYRILCCQERVVRPGQVVEIRGSFQYVGDNPRRVEPVPNTSLSLRD